MAPHVGVDVRCDLMWPPPTLRWLCRRSEEHALTRPAGPTHGADAVDRLRADYDATPYTSDAFPQSAPGQLAAIAHVFGLDVPAVSRARVLETVVPQTATSFRSLRRIPRPWPWASISRRYRSTSAASVCRP